MIAADRVLSRQQTAVLQLRRLGYSRREIARLLDLSPATVRSHLAAAHRERPSDTTQGGEG